MPDNNTIAFKINLLSTNCDKFETFVNGTEAETVLLGGVATHTLRYFSQHLTAVNNAAAASADAAEASKQAAHTSEIAAKGSEDAAKLSETNAAASAASAATSAGDIDAAVDLAQQAVLDAQAAANNINIRKYPQSGYVYAIPGQTVITPNFTMDTVKDNVAIYLDGIKQGRGGYTFTATDITLSEALAGGETIEVISANADAGAVTPTYTELPVGTPFPHFAASGYVPAGCAPMDGAEYTRAQFPVLYDTYLAGGKLKTCTYAVWAAQVGLTGNCGMFALDTVNQKFKVPLLKDGDSITQAASASELGKSYKAGLPNVYGTTGGFRSDVGNSGCIRASSTVGTIISIPGTGTGLIATIDASNGGTDVIYGKSTTVTDEQVRVRWFIVMANAQNNTSVFDWSNYMAGLAGKLNADFSNAPQNRPYIIDSWESTNRGLWYKKWSDGLIEQGIAGNGGAAVTFPTPFLRSDKTRFYKPGLLCSNAAAYSPTFVVQSDSLTGAVISARIDGVNNAGLYWTFEVSGY